MMTTRSLELSGDPLAGGCDVGHQNQRNREAANADERSRRPIAMESAPGTCQAGRADVRDRSVSAIVTQSLALALGVLVVLYGLGAAYAVIFPRDAGQWTGRVITAVYLVNVPVGVFALLLTLMARRGSEALRRVALATSAIALLLPLVITVTDWLRAIVL